MAVAPIRGFRRRWVLWLVLALGALAIALGALSGFYIDVLWFNEVGYEDVFWTRFWTRIVLGAAFGAAFFVLVYGNLLIVRRLRPRFRQYTPEEETIERYRVAVEPHVRWATPALSLLLAIFAGVGIASQWESFLLWREAGDAAFGRADPLFGNDVAYYVLSLPFLKTVQGWLYTSLVVIALVSAAAHYLWGGIRLRAIGERVTPQVKAHLSVLLGLIVLVRAWGYRFTQFDLLQSPRGTVTGASYTDVNAELPALTLLIWLSVAVAVLFLVNIRFRGWALPVLGIGILVLASVVAGGIYPAIVQRFQVAPQEPQKEAEFIGRNIEFTRAAYGIDQVQTRVYPAAAGVTPEEFEEASSTVPNIRLWNPDVLLTAYAQLQRIRPYYEFTDVDVDRYEIDGERRVVMIAAREIYQPGILGGGQTWQNQHLVFTHGYGAAATRVDQVTSAGAPEFILRDLPEEGALAEELAEPRLYFQESVAVPYVIVNTEPNEFDYPRGATTGDEEFADTRYDGAGGIEVGGLFRRLAFAWRFRDVNLLISSLVTEDSRVLLNTDLTTRVQKIAPFLRFDGDPYAAIVDEQFVWIWDAYTLSDAYPYSQETDMALTTGNDGLPTRANYIRNSVKVVVDAYDGTTTFYVADDTDPIIQTWSRAFPGMFTPLSEASDDLRAHFRYPEDLFKIQAHQYANYHVTDPTQFYRKDDFWSIPLIPEDPTAETPNLVELDPYYVLLRPPDSDEDDFLLFTPFTPAERPNMVAWMAAHSDPATYGQLQTFEFQAQNIPGPGQVSGFISQQTDVSQDVSLFNQQGSRVIFGDLLAIPIGNSFLYVQPLYLQARQAPIPELKRVVVVNGQDVFYENDFASALAAAFEEEPVVPPEDEPPVTPPPDDGPQVPGNVSELLERAEQHFEAAEAALQAGDLATYEAEIEEARRLIQQAAEQLAEG